MFRKLMIEKGSYALMDKVVLAVTSFLYIIISARILPVDEYGALMLVISIYSFLILFGELGTGSALIKYGAERKDIKEVLSNTLFVKLIGAFVFSLLSVLLVLVLPGYFRTPQLYGLLALLPFFITGTILSTFFKQTLQSKHEFKRILMIDIIGLGAMVVLLVTLGTMGIIESSIHILMILAAVQFTTAVWGYRLSRPVLSFDKRLDMRWLAKLTRFGMYATIGSLGSIMYTRMDIIMLGIFLGSTSVAIYSSASVIAITVFIIPQAASMVYFPMVSRISVSKSQTRYATIRSLYFKSVGTVLLITVPMSLVFILFPEKILYLLFQDKYLASAPVLRVLALWGIIRPWGNLSGAALEGLGKPNVNATLIWVATILNVTGNYILIPRMGAIGAAVASVIAFSISTPISMAYFFKITKQDNEAR